MSGYILADVSVHVPFEMCRNCPAFEMYVETCYADGDKFSEAYQCCNEKICRRVIPHYDAYRMSRIFDKKESDNGKTEQDPWR